MKIAALAISAALLGLASVTPASALPAIGHGTVIQSDGIKLVAQKRNMRKRYVKNKRKYRAGHRYSKAPRGWHRHNKRPSYWQTRNCIMVGPLWYCP